MEGLCKHDRKKITEHMARQHLELTNQLDGTRKEAKQAKKMMH